MEGIIWYRLLGSHPAASGRRLMYSFPGEAVRASTVLEYVVKEHHVNESIYKLDVLVARSSLSSSGSSDSAAGELVPSNKNDILQNYDRIEITVSRKNFVEEMKEKQQHSLLPRHFDGNYAEARLDHSAPLLGASPSVNTTTNTSATCGNDLDFERVAALMRKTFPLYPGRICKDPPVAPLPRGYTCALCNFPLRSSSVTLWCCNYAVCKECKVAAETMSSVQDCVVCGRQAPLGESVEVSDPKRMKREEAYGTSVKQEDDEGQKVMIPSSSVGSSGSSSKTNVLGVVSERTCTSEPSSSAPPVGRKKDKTHKKSTRENYPRCSEIYAKDIQIFGSTLENNLENSLALLSQDYSLFFTKNGEERRQRSEFLKEMDSESKTVKVNR